MNKDLMFSSKTDLWATPQTFFDELNSEFGFDTDVCALASNAKCAKFFTPEVNGLTQAWEGVCWMNPPYGRGIRMWLKKAYESAQQGATVICLVPSRTDTQWWHDYCMKGKFALSRAGLNSEDTAMLLPSRQR